MTRTCVNLAMGVIAVALSVIAITAHPPMPRCAEDATLVGVGEFEDGRYPYYVCGPAVDDYMPEPTGDVGTAVIGYPDGTVIILSGEE